MNPDEAFREASDKYQRAIQLRDSLSFAEAIVLFDEAAEIIARIPVSVPFQLAFIYDKALAYDLSGQHELGRELFKRVAELYDQFALSDPEDPSVEGFEGLIWGIKDYLSLWSGPVSNEEYLSSINSRRWRQEMMPLKVFVDRGVDSGFDDELSNILVDGFSAWGRSSDQFSWTTTQHAQEASIVFTRVADLGSSGGHTAFEESASVTGAPQLKLATIQISLHSRDANAYNEVEIRALRSLAMHEAGHALGLDGHSPHATDLMYWKSPLQELSPRDIRTFRLLYSV
ncbi:MAG: matrixin family metalloprotease [Candidatus Obscuribacterales bacterium]|nr:matrixin family metalloprotease [Candidatus Obscuribacterales bacterium]